MVQFSKAEADAQNARIVATRQYYEPDTIIDTSATSGKQQYTNRYMSIPPDAHQQAIDIVIRHAKTYKNWQAVIRRAIYYGLPHLETPMEKVTAIKQSKSTATIMSARTCPAQDDIPTRCVQICRECVTWKAWQAEK